MNLADLCADGREKYEEFEKFGEAFRVHGRVQSMVMMYQAHQKFFEHMQDCELCTPVEDSDE